MSEYESLFISGVDGNEDVSTICTSKVLHRRPSC